MINRAVFKSKKAIVACETTHEVRQAAPREAGIWWGGVYNHLLPDSQKKMNAYMSQYGVSYIIMTSAGRPTNRAAAEVGGAQHLF